MQILSLLQVNCGYAMNFFSVLLYSVNQKTKPLLFLPYLWFLLTDCNNYSPFQSEMISAHVIQNI